MASSGALLGATALAGSSVLAAPAVPSDAKAAPPTSGASIEMGAKGSPAPPPSPVTVPTPKPAAPATAPTAKPAPAKPVAVKTDAKPTATPKPPVAVKTAVPVVKTAAKPVVQPTPVATPAVKTAAPPPAKAAPTKPAAAVKSPAVKVPAAKPLPAIKPELGVKPAPAEKPTPTVKPAPAAKPVPVAKPVPAVKPTVRPAIIAGPVTPTLRDLAQTEKLANGLTLVTRHDRTSPRIAFSLLIRAGAADEPAGNAGWRRVLTESMLRAAKTEGFAPVVAAKKADGTDTLPDSLTGLQMQRLAEAAGGQVGASVGDDTIEFWAVGETRGASALLDVLLQMVTHPRLATADLEAGRRRVAAAGEASQDDVAQSATAALRAQIYRNAAGQPLAYGLVPQGTETSRGALTDDRIQAYYRAFFRPENMVLSAAGSLDAASLAARLQSVTAPKAEAADDIARGTVPSFAPIVKSDPTLLVRQLPTADAWIFVSFLGAPSNGGDLPALAVMSALLGEAPGARLPRRLLGSRPPSLGGPPDETAQQAAVSFVPRRFGSEFVLYAQTESNAVESVKNALLDEARKLRDANVGEAELTRAKNFVRGNWAIDREPLRERAYSAGLAAATGSASDVSWPTTVMKVTPADIRRVAQKYLGGYAVALIMPQE